MNDIYRDYTSDFTEVNDDKLNARFVNSIMTQIRLMAMNMFKWEGLPDNIEPYMIERWLFDLGYVGFAYDKEYGYMTLWSNPTNLLELYYRPTRVTMTGNANIFDRFVYYGDNSDKLLIDTPKPVYSRDNTCVIIRNNPSYISTYEILYPYIYSFYAAKRKEITMLDQLQLQSLIMCSQEDKASLEMLKRDIRGNKPIIALNIRGMKYEPKPLVLTNNNFLLDLQSFSKSIYGEIMERLGIDSVNYEKAERMITSEVDKNKEQTNAMGDMLLEQRQHACDLINDLFGLNVKVSLNSTIKDDTEKPSLSIASKSISHGIPLIDDEKGEN